MALSCSRFSSYLSLVRLSCFRKYGPPNGQYSRFVACPFRLSTSRHYSSSTDRHGIGRYVASRLQYANNKYEGFLKRRFPNFYQLHHIFIEGFKLLFHDTKDVWRIRAKMLCHGIQFQDLPYREMEKLRQFHRNLIKAIPLLMISIPPFANFLVFVLMYLFPRQLLIPHFWTPRQQVEFRGVYHSFRAQHHQPVLRGLEDMSQQVKDVRLNDLCTKVQRGGHPKVSEIIAVRSLFSRPPLGIKRMNVDQMRHMCRLLFLTPHLPGFLIGRRLKSHVLELLLLDRALMRLRPQQLTESELKQACYVRGLNSDGLNLNQCHEWLSQWLQVSTSLKESEVSLLLYNLVLLSVNYPNSSSPH
ncbi:LETM1 domain-containing protein 1-like isoform X2 [Thalassophryne amazonica]|uniref:LETM1 domain-containing protein 1-like isoform X2 n=1 Tax=Thalassophryne amazonica TaxID=390379 RepID=UPI001470D75B|nr:LETM1 domain-containing protein 1-like isoform X2 [Thalassophryne amazonica]